MLYINFFLLIDLSGKDISVLMDIFSLQTSSILHSIVMFHWWSLAVILGTDMRLESPEPALFIC